MSHVRTTAIAAAALFASGASAIASELIRIEPRPYYGAVVSIENGVRVYRGLPTQSLMIINPGNKTPVSLNFTRTIEHKAADASSGNGGGNNNAGDGNNGNGRGSVSTSGFGPNATIANNQSAGAPTGTRVHRMRSAKPSHH